MLDGTEGEPTPSINYGGWTKGGVHGKDRDVPAVSASMDVAGEVGRALCKDCVGKLQRWQVTTLASCQWRQVLKALTAANN